MAIELPRSDTTTGRIYFFDCGTYDNALAQVAILSKSMVDSATHLDGGEYFNAVFVRSYPCVLIVND